MFGSQILEVAIGVIFIYLLASIICTAIREGVESWMQARASYLEHAIRELLHDRSGTGLASALYSHPLIYGLFSGEYKPSDAKKALGLTRGGNLPTYIPSRSFAVALMDIAARGAQTDAVSADPNAPPISLDSIRANIANLQNHAVQRVLLSAIDAAQGDINKLQTNLEAWFDSAMDRISGRYKKLTQQILFVIGLLVAVGLNIDSLRLADYLYRNDAARAATVAQAQVAATDTGYTQHKYDQAKGDLEALHLPIGWQGNWVFANPMTYGWWAFTGPLLGWLFTAFAATLGAPFWFDMLNKVMVIRSTVKPHEKSPEEASEDRQLKPAVAQTVIQQQAPPGPPPAQAAAVVPTTARDAASNVDGCDVDPKSAPPTPDDELPEAEGGIAS